MNEYQQYGIGQQPQFGPQSLFGGALGAPLGGFLGRNIGGLFGNPNLGSRIGEIAGGIGGGLFPLGADPVAAQQQQLQQLQQLQQQQQAGQLTPQGGFFGGLINQFSRPIANTIADVAGVPGLAPVAGGLLQGLGGLLPFNAGPAQLQQMQQLQQLQQQAQQQAGQLTPQGGFFGGLINQFSKPIANTIADVAGVPGLAPVAGGLLQGLGGLLPFNAGPQGAGPQAIVQQLKQLQAQQQQLQQALQQVQQQAMLLQQQLGGQQPQAQGQIAPQGWLGDMVSQYAQPVGGFIGSQFGNQGLGSAIGGIAGQLGRMLPLSADPWSAYQAQQPMAGQPTVH
jgi:hypothetical protein